MFNLPSLFNRPPVSYWFKAVPDRRRFPVLQGERRVDVAIIGGGIAGVSAAYWAAKAGLKTVVLEAGNIATGDTGYTTAMATRFLDSADAIIKAWDVSEAGIQLLRQTIEAEKIKCEWQTVDGIGFSQNPDSSAFAKTTQTLRAKDPTVEYLEKDRASAAVGAPVEAAYRKKDSEGQFHARKFLLGLVRRAVKHGALFFENSEATDIELGDAITIKTARGAILADRLVVAAGPPPEKFFPAAAKNISAAVTYIIHVKFKRGKPFPAAVFWDDLTPYHYFRWVGDKDLLLGGQDWKMTDEKPAADPHLELENWLRRLVGKNYEFKVVNKWQGSIFYTPDTLPFVGQHPDYGERVIFLTGWAGVGMAFGFLAGQMAADLARGRENKWQKLFSFNRLM